MSISLQRKNKPWTEARRDAHNNNPTHKPHSEETKIKISAAQKGKPKGPQSAETIQKRVASLLGHNVSEETRAKISAANTGKRYKQKNPRPADSGANHHGTKWWNNGTTNKRSATCPGPEWTQGIAGEAFGKGKCRWTDGVTVKVSAESPGPGWVKGDLQKGKPKKANKIN